MIPINKIKNDQIIFSTKPSVFQVDIRQDGVLVYRNETSGGVLNFVENISSVVKKGQTIEGRCQHLVFGHPVIWMFAYDQLKQALEKLYTSDLYKKMVDFFNSPEAQQLISKDISKKKREN